MKAEDGFWKRLRVLVTGADGFMGSHLTERLLQLGAKVSIFVRSTSVTGTTLYSFKYLQPFEKDFEAILTGNIAFADSTRLIQKNRPEVIFHLAADAYVPKSFDHPVEVMETNLIGTLNVLTAAEELPSLSRLVCTSSSEIYGTAQYAPIDEAHPLNPSSPYAASKAAADRYAFAYWNTYHLPVTIIRPFNTYGPRHTYDVIPKFIRLALAGEPLTVHGTGRQRRDFTYVDDMVRAFLVMGRDPRAVGQAINFGFGEDVTILAVARAIKRIAQSDSKIVFTPRRTSEVDQLLCDYRKARRLFGWKPEVSLEEGLRQNIEWAKENWQ